MQDFTLSPTRVSETLLMVNSTENSVPLSEKAVSAGRHCRLQGSPFLRPLSCSNLPDAGQGHPCEAELPFGAQSSAPTGRTLPLSKRRGWVTHLNSKPTVRLVWWAGHESASLSRGDSPAGRPLVGSHCPSLAQSLSPCSASHANAHSMVTN